MQFGVFRLSSDQRAIGCFREIVFSGARIKVGEFALRVRVRGGEFQRSLELRDGVVFLALRASTRPSCR